MKEIRVADITACESRADNRDGTGQAAQGPYKLEGIPVVFDQMTEIKTPAGSYFEVIKRGALDNADLSDSRLLYNHDLDKIPLAKTPKTMQLQITDTELRMSAELPETETAKEVYTAVKRGDLSGMSFSFTVPDGGDYYDAATNTREIRQIDKIFECSIVPFPAYPQTSIEARSVIQDGEARRQAIIDCNKLLMKEGF